MVQQPTVDPVQYQIQFIHKSILYKFILKVQLGFQDIFSYDEHVAFIPQWR